MTNGNEGSGQPQTGQQMSPEEKKRREERILAENYDAARCNISNGRLEEGLSSARELKAYDLVQRAGNAYEARGDLANAAAAYMALAQQGEYAPGRRVADALLRQAQGQENEQAAQTLGTALELAVETEAPSLIGEIGQAAERREQWETAARAYIAAGHETALRRVKGYISNFGEFRLNYEDTIEKKFKDREEQ